MRGLPASTEIRIVITKKKVYEHFASEMSAERRKSFDADIARITIVNEISPASLNISDGTEIHAFFVVAVALRQKNFDKQNVTFIARMFGQNLVLILSYEQDERLALWQTRLIMNEWHPAGTQSLPMRGLNMDAIWEGVVTEIGGLQIEEGHTLNEQIALNDQKAKLQKEIDKLEKQARMEKQPKRKLELVQKLKSLTKEMEKNE